jgi:hypothetical protein
VRGDLIHLLWLVVMVAGLDVAGSSDVDAHDWCTDLRQPGTGLSCCGGYECHPLLQQQIRYVDDDRMEFFLHAEWSRRRPAVILERPSPDGRVHACWNAANKRLLSVILPGTL